MEEKLFWIGILVGIHLFLTHHFNDKGKFKSEKFARHWHAVFTSLISFVGMLLLTVSLDNRSGDVVTTSMFSARQVLYALGAAVAGWAWGYFRRGGKPAPAKAGAEKDKPADKHAAPPPLGVDMEWSETVFSAVVLASVVMYLFIQAFKIPSGSMRMTFLEGDHLFVNKFIYGFRIPYTQKKLIPFAKIKRGDIVVFQFPSSDPEEQQCGGKQYGKDFIKRVIGQPGEKVEIRNGAVYINDKLIGDEPYVQYLDSRRYPGSSDKLLQVEYQRFWETRGLAKMVSELVRDNFGPVIVPPGHYMV
ncbi:MAG: signal peptidase I, partial [Elusimicrobia bacterium RIFOXYB2_FULL_62_6]